MLVDGIPVCIPLLQVVWETCLGNLFSLITHDVEFRHSTVDRSLQKACFTWVKGCVDVVYGSA